MPLVAVLLFEVGCPVLLFWVLLSFNLKVVNSLVLQNLEGSQLFSASKLKLLLAMACCSWAYLLSVSVAL